MTALHIAAGAAGLIAGLLLTSGLLTAQDEPGVPYAQMNRASYDTPRVTGAAYIQAGAAEEEDLPLMNGPLRRGAVARSAAADGLAIVPVAQMNRQGYR